MGEHEAAIALRDGDARFRDWLAANPGCGFYTFLRFAIGEMPHDGPLLTPTSVAGKGRFGVAFHAAADDGAPAILKFYVAGVAVGDADQQDAHHLKTQGAISIVEKLYILASLVRGEHSAQIVDDVHNIATAGLFVQGPGLPDGTRIARTRRHPESRKTIIVLTAASETTAVARLNISAATECDMLRVASATVPELAPAYLGAAAAPRAPDSDLVANFLAMSRVPGEMLYYWLRTSDFRAQPDAARAFGAQLARMHSAGIAHGDLHSGNIMIDTATWRIKIIDWSRIMLQRLLPGLLWCEAITYDLAMLRYGGIKNANYQLFVQPLLHGYLASRTTAAATLQRIMDHIFPDVDEAERVHTMNTFLDIYSSSFAAHIPYNIDTAMLITSGGLKFETPHAVDPGDASMVEFEIEHGPELARARARRQRSRKRECASYPSEQGDGRHVERIECHGRVLSRCAAGAAAGRDQQPLVRTLQYARSARALSLRGYRSDAEPPQPTGAQLGERCAHGHDRARAHLQHVPQRRDALQRPHRPHRARRRGAAPDV